MNFTIYLGEINSGTYGWGFFQALCEKGLLAMENSHRRIISELEEKHRQETEALKLEKEQALAEETHATLAGN